MPAIVPSDHLHEPLYHRRVEVDGDRTRVVEICSCGSERIIDRGPTSAVWEPWSRPEHQPLGQCCIPDTVSGTSGRDEGGRMHKLLALLVLILVGCTPIGDGRTGVLVDATPDAPDAPAVAGSGSARVPPCEQLAPDASPECFALCAGSDAAFPPPPGKCASLTCALEDGSSWTFAVCADPL